MAAERPLDGSCCWPILMVISTMWSHPVVPGRLGFSTASGGDRMDPELQVTATCKDNQPRGAFMSSTGNSSAAADILLWDNLNRMGLHWHLPPSPACTRAGTWVRASRTAKGLEAATRWACARAWWPMLLVLAGKQLLPPICRLLELPRTGGLLRL